ncbi:MAG TPA: hypothetical protein HA218_00175 [Nanoarchaeota archaeon]|nr:hypothetical protein [Nanoarchaeota archaeon]
MKGSYLLLFLLVSAILALGASGCSSEQDSEREQITLWNKYIDERNQITTEFWSIARNNIADMKNFTNGKITEQQFLDALEKNLEEYNRLKSRLENTSPPEELFDAHENLIRAHNLMILSIKSEITGTELYMDGNFDLGREYYEKAKDYLAQASMEFDSVDAATTNAERKLQIIPETT